MDATAPANSNVPYTNIRVHYSDSKDTTAMHPLNDLYIVADNDEGLGGTLVAPYRPFQFINTTNPDLLGTQKQHDDGEDDEANVNATEDAEMLRVASLEVDHLYQSARDAEFKRSKVLADGSLVEMLTVGRGLVSRYTLKYRTHSFACDACGKTYSAQDAESNGHCCQSCVCCPDCHTVLEPTMNQDTKAAWVQCKNCHWRSAVQKDVNDLNTHLSELRLWGGQHEDIMRRGAAVTRRANREHEKEISVSNAVIADRDRDLGFGIGGTIQYGDGTSTSLMSAAGILGGAADGTASPSPSSAGGASPMGASRRDSSVSPAPNSPLAAQRHHALLSSIAGGGGGASPSQQQSQQQNDVVDELTGVVTMNKKTFARSQRVLDYDRRHQAKTRELFSKLATNYNPLLPTQPTPFSSFSSTAAAAGTSTTGFASIAGHNKSASVAAASVHAGTGGAATMTDAEIAKLPPSKWYVHGGGRNPTGAAAGAAPTTTATGAAAALNFSNGGDDLMNSSTAHGAQPPDMLESTLNEEDAANTVKNLSATATTATATSTIAASNFNTTNNSNAPLITQRPGASAILCVSDFVGAGLSVADTEDDWFEGPKAAPEWSDAVSRAKGAAAANFSASNAIAHATTATKALLNADGNGTYSVTCTSSSPAPSSASAPSAAALKKSIVGSILGTSNARIARQADAIGRPRWIRHAPLNTRFTVTHPITRRDLYHPTPGAIMDSASLSSFLSGKRNPSLASNTCAGRLLPWVRVASTRLSEGFVNGTVKNSNNVTRPPSANAEGSPSPSPAAAMTSAMLLPSDPSALKARRAKRLYCYLWNHGDTDVKITAMRVVGVNGISSSSSTGGTTAAAAAPSVVCSFEAAERLKITNAIADAQHKRNLAMAAAANHSKPALLDDEEDTAEGSIGRRGRSVTGDSAGSSLAGSISNLDHTCSTANVLSAMEGSIATTVEGGGAATANASGASPPLGATPDAPSGGSATDAEALLAATVGGNASVGVGIGGGGGIGNASTSTQPQSPETSPRSGAAKQPTTADTKSTRAPPHKAASQNPLSHMLIGGAAGAGGGNSSSAATTVYLESRDKDVESSLGQSTVVGDATALQLEKVGYKCEGSRMLFYIDIVDEADEAAAAAEAQRDEKKASEEGSPASKPSGRKGASLLPTTKMVALQITAIASMSPTSKLAIQYNAYLMFE